MNKYKTIFGEKIIGTIVNDKYSNVVIVSESTGVLHVVHKSDAYSSFDKKDMKFNLYECQNSNEIIKGK